jgi:hypothetical protein
VRRLLTLAKIDDMKAAPTKTAVAKSAMGNIRGKSTMPMANLKQAPHESNSHTIQAQGKGAVNGVTGTVS